MLKNQKVIVLGGSSGMGLAAARLLAAEGAHVVIASRCPSYISSTIDVVTVSGDHISGKAVDIEKII